jgi:polar amino acid transport system substrate-binding protein
MPRNGPDDGKMKRRQLLASAAFIASDTMMSRIGMTGLPLRVGAALPDPPFEFMTGNGPAGFDIALMQRIAERLGRQWQLVRYQGADFNGIFAGLDKGAYDCVASGTTITSERQRVADFCAPYVVSGQSLVVDPSHHPNVHNVDDLHGLVIGVQQGNTSQPVADRLVAEHRAARVRVYAYDEIEQALGDLSTGGRDVFMKLAPVTEWYVRDRPRPWENAS